jgi:hypothetical protein
MNRMFIRFEACSGYILGQGLPAALVYTVMKFPVSSPREWLAVSRWDQIANPI